MRGLLRAAAALLLASAALALPGCGAPAPEKRSIILVTLDTTRADYIGAYGSDRVPTPVLDRIAAEGVLFEEAMSQVPLTLPSHSSILTGRYPASHGVRHNGIYHLPDEAETLTEIVGAEGFRTAGFIAAYVMNKGYGVEQGFDHYSDVDQDRYQGGEDNLFAAERTAEEVNASVFEWLDRRPKGPFFMWVHYYDPHDPYAPPEREGVVGEGYAREISYTDAALGDLIARLEADGIYDDSILVVIGDHGESLEEHGERTHGLFIYEGAMHVPFMMRAPGLLPEGTRVGGPVEQVDVLPTLLSLTGRAIGESVQGQDLMPRINQEDDGLEAWVYGESLMPRIEFGWSELYSARGSRYKYIEAPTPELYDLQSDPDEMNNLFESDPARARELGGRLAAWKEASVAGGSLNATREASDDELATLAGLGYLDGSGGTTFEFDESRAIRDLPDPKEMIGEVRRLDEARQLIADEKYAESLVVIDQILAANSKNHLARASRVKALIELRRHDEAEWTAKQNLEAAIKDPNRGVMVPKAMGLMAGVYQATGQLDKAIKQFRDLLVMDPRNTEARVDLARILNDRGETGEARKLIDAVLAENPRHGEAGPSSFLMHWRAGDAEAALADAKRLAVAKAGRRAPWSRPAAC